MRKLQVSLCMALPISFAMTPLARPEFKLTKDLLSGQETPLARPEFKLTKDLLSGREPAQFQLNEAQIAQCLAPLMPGMEMYLTPLGASALGGEWGSWQLTDAADAPSTAAWRLNFMSTEWRTMHITSEGNLSAIAKPVEIDELKEQHNFVPEDTAFGMEHWTFVEDLLAPGVAMKYDGMNYSMGKAPGSFPVTYTASPQLKDGAIPAPSWQYWAIMDCKKKLVAVVALEETDGMRPGRCKIYNNKGQKATEAIPDALIPRLQFVDINQHLLATAEAPALGSDIPMPQLPRRGTLGNMLPYTIRFERGGYYLSSDLLKKDFRWILSAAVQLRSLQDATQGFTPLFVKDKYLLLSVVLALGLIFLVIFGTMLVSSLRTMSRIFFHRDKSLPNYQTPLP